ncbi:MAG: hypothetical protein EWM72_03351 [Nitrospira sp.]|nr:MAG: hypothetical protein EWM72_03351 [Nitrospira sp.]
MQWMSALRLLSPHGERPDRHFILESGDHAIRVPRVELKEVGMDVDLGRLEIRVIIVVPLARQQQVHAVIHVGADDRRQLEIVVGPGQTFFFMQHVDQAVLVDHGRLFPLRLRQGNRHADEVDVVMFSIGIVGAETPSALLAGLGRLGGPFTVFVLVNRFQPGRTVMVRRKRYPLAEVRFEERPGHLGRRRVKEDCRSGAVIPLGRPCVLWILCGAFPLTDRHVAVPLPVPHGRIVGHDLAFLIVRVTGLALCRDKHFDPIFDIDDDRIGLPVRLLALINNLERLPEPIDRRPDQLLGRHAELHPALSIRQFSEVRHAIGVCGTHLKCIVEPAIAPHARHIVMRDVAVEEEFAGEVLTATAAAFRLEVQGF